MEKNKILELSMKSVLLGDYHEGISVFLQAENVEALPYLFKDIVASQGTGLTDIRLPFKMVVASRAFAKYKPTKSAKIDVNKALGYIAEAMDELETIDNHGIDERLGFLLRAAYPIKATKPMRVGTGELFQAIIEAFKMYGKDAAHVRTPMLKVDNIKEFLYELVGSDVIVDLANTILVADNTTIFGESTSTKKEYRISEAEKDEIKTIFKIVREACSQILEHEIFYAADGELVKLKIANQFNATKAASKLVIPEYTNSVKLTLE